MKTVGTAKSMPDCCEQRRLMGTLAFMRETDWEAANRVDGT